MINVGIDVPNGKHFILENLFSFNFEQKKYSEDNLKDNADTLVSLFS